MVVALSLACGAHVSRGHSVSDWLKSTGEQSFDRNEDHGCRH